MLTGAAVAYGLTVGGYNAATVAITPLGLRIMNPIREGDDIAAKREALLKPRVLREFLQKYNNAAIPRDDIAQNVLVTLGVPKDRAAGVLLLILEGAEALGFIRVIKDKKYIDLKGTQAPPAEQPPPTDEDSQSSEEERPDFRPLAVVRPTVSDAAVAADAREKKVFITHGKNKGFIDPIKQLLTFGELEAVVATEKQTVSQPVPQKVMEDMRSCGAAIIHVEGERKLFDPDSKEHVALNENVLIEIGAAMALYGERFILVVKEGVTLPSNLQGLFEVRYSGEALDGKDTIKLLQAITDMKKRQLPKARQ
jgi:predicted nucleotide-binding protein